MRPVSAREFIPMAHPTNIWVTGMDNSEREFQLPVILGDTLVGYVNGSVQEMTLSQTKEVRAKYPQNGRTALFVAGIVAVGVGTAMAIRGLGTYCTIRLGGDGRVIPC